MMTCTTRVLSGALAALTLGVQAATAGAQGANPLIDGVKAQHAMVAGNLAKTADKVPEDLYSFKPTPEVRSLGQLIGHVADAQFSICSGAASEKAPREDIEKTVTTKADLVKALAESTAYCDKVLAGMDDKKGMEMVKFFGMTPRALVLSFNVSHNFEHYGNLVTYMRLKGIVPPSSEPRK